MEAVVLSIDRPITSSQVCSRGMASREVFEYLQSILGSHLLHIELDQWMVSFWLRSKTLPLQNIHLFVSPQSTSFSLSYHPPIGLGDRFISMLQALEIDSQACYTLEEKLYSVATTLSSEYTDGRGEKLTSIFHGSFRSQLVCTRKIGTCHSSRTVLSHQSQGWLLWSSRAARLL